MHPRPLSSGARMIKFKLRHKERYRDHETRVCRKLRRPVVGAAGEAGAGLPLVEAGHVPAIFRDRQMRKMRKMLSEF